MSIRDEMLLVSGARLLREIITVAESGEHYTVTQSQAERLRRVLEASGVALRPDEDLEEEPL